MADRLPPYLHIVHAGDHQELVDAIKVIARYQRSVQRLNVLHVSEAANAEELAEFLTEPAALILFTGHGTPSGEIGTQCGWRLAIDRISGSAGRPLSAYGVIMDACYGWDFRDSVRRQSTSDLAYLAACGEAPYTDTQLIVNVAISLIGYPGKKLPQSPGDADKAFGQSFKSAQGSWCHSVLVPTMQSNDEGPHVHSPEGA